MLRCKTIILLVCWVTCASLYYVLLLDQSELSEVSFISVIIFISIVIIISVIFFIGFIIFNLILIIPMHLEACTS